MINNLVLENFQGFSSRQSITLAPLTLIFGPNSSGKSSIARSLLLLQQSFSGFSTSHQGLIFRGSSIDLASFSNVIHKHDLNNLLSIGLAVPAISQSMPIGRMGGSMRNPETILKTLGEIKYAVETSDDDVSRIKVQYEFNQGEFVANLGRAMSSGSVSIELARDTEGAFSVVDFSGLDILNDLYALTATPQSDRFESDLDVVETLYPSDAVLSHDDWQEGLRSIRIRGLYPSIQPGFFGRNEQILSKVSEVLETLFRVTRISMSRAVDGISHVKPLRDIPERLLIVDENDPIHSRRVGPASRRRPSHDVVSEWIKRLTNGQYELRTEEFSSKEVGFLGTLRAKHLFDTKTKTPVSFKDVGVGLSQVLPIVEALEVAQRVSARSSNAPGKTTIIEQPELHLHPRMQADLMDLMIDVVLEPNSEVQIIAETHSENMVLRLQKRIRDGKISPSQVAILYADRDADGNNQITELSLNDDGDFNEEWPLSFADVRVQDLF